MTSTGRAQIAIVKPEYGINGGFERHLDVLVQRLESRGHAVTHVGIRGDNRLKSPFGIPVTEQMWEWHYDYWNYLCLVEQVRNLDLDRFDMVLSTQPPTYLVDHPRTLALCYHQLRVFYDLAEPFARAGHVMAHIHDVATEAVRGIDMTYVHDVRHWLVGSEEVRNRLGTSWSIADERMTTYAAPADVPAGDPPRYDASGPAVCVSRNEWPKRTETFVAAMHLTDTRGHLVGGGGRLDFVRSIDAELAADPKAAHGYPQERLWINPGVLSPGWSPFPGPASGRVEIHGETDNATRNRLYDNAGVVVCPAYREDYGLTAIEAMHRAKPIIVCTDGGGLTEFVSDGVTGFVVEPTPEAIAEAIDRIKADPAAAERMGRAGRERALGYTWDRALRAFDDGVEKVLGS